MHDRVQEDLDSIKGARSAVWTRANLREVLPELPSPASWAALGPVLNEGSRRYYGRLLARADVLGPPFALLAGRPYWNLTQFARVGGFARISAAAMMRDLGHAGEISAEDERPVKPSLTAFLSVLPTFLRLALQRLLLPVRLRRHFAMIGRTREAFATTDPTALTDAQVWDRIQSLNRLGPRFIATTQSIVAMLSFEVLRPLEFLCRRLRFPTSRLLDSYLAVGERTVSGQQAFDLLELALVARRDERVRSYFAGTVESADLRKELNGTEFLNRFDEFLTNYGHRAPYESDLSIPRYREDPTPILAAVRSQVVSEHRPTAADVEAKQSREAVEAWREFVGRIAPWQRPVIVPIVRMLLRKAKKGYAWREFSRSELTRAGEHTRNWILVLAERLVARSWIDSTPDVFFLLPDEVQEAIAHPDEGAGLRHRVAEHRRRWQELADIEVPLVVDGRATNAVKASATEPTAELRGQCISSGLAEGEVVVIHEPMQFSRMKPGAILVAPATDPAWTPLFVQAAGVIVEVEGHISHAAIVAREFGLPALANVRDATRLLRNGDVVRLDATNETVEIVRRSDREE